MEFHGKILTSSFSLLIRKEIIELNETHFNTVQLEIPEIESMIYIYVLLRISKD